jgi:hypothetical protein
VSGIIIRRHRVLIGSLWRKLNPGQQALLVLVYLVLVYLHQGETFAELAAVFEVGISTAWRYVGETVALLAGRAPKLREAVRDAKKAGYAHVVGTLIPIDRVAADRQFYSGKHRRQEMNLQVIAGPDGDVGWVSGALPGSVHDRKRIGSGACWPSWRRRAWSRWPTRATRAVRTRRSRTRGGTSRSHRRTPIMRTRDPAHPRRKSERPAQDPPDPPQAAMLPVARRAARQGHPRFAGPRRKCGMKMAH